MDWSDRDPIVEALTVTYPDVNRADLSLDQVTDFVQRLPEFSGHSAVPEPKYIQDILWAWMKSADQG